MTFCCHRPCSREQYKGKCCCYFIHRLDIRDKCVVDVDDYSENTDLGREIYYMIEDTIMESIKKPEKPNEKWNLFGNKDLMKEIEEYVKSKDKNKLH